MARRGQRVRRWHDRFRPERGGVAQPTHRLGRNRPPSNRRRPGTQPVTARPPPTPRPRGRAKPRQRGGAARPRVPPRTAISRTPRGKATTTPPRPGRRRPSAGCSGTSAATPSARWYPTPAGGPRPSSPWPGPSTANAPSTRCRYWPTPWRMPVAPSMPYSPTVADGRGRTPAGAGSSTCCWRRDQALRFSWRM